MFLLKIKCIWNHSSVNTAKSWETKLPEVKCFFLPAKESGQIETWNLIWKFWNSTSSKKHLGQEWDLSLKREGYIIYL